MTGRSFGISKSRALRQRGNTLMEFALISTVLLMMTIGVADFGRIFAMGNKVYNAAAAGTAYGALSPAHYTDTDGMRNAALADLGNIPSAVVNAGRTCRCTTAGTAVSCPASCASGYPQTYVEVDVTIPFQSLSGLPWMPGLTNVKGKSIIRVE